jgi:orotate phosphoribosyltransferase
MDSITEADHFSQEVGAVTKTFKDARHLLTSGLRTPCFVNLGNLAGSLCVFNNVDFLILIRHTACLPIAFLCSSHSLAC